MERKRYDQYPQLATMARSMTNEGVALVLAWHLVIVAGFERFVDEEARKKNLGGADVCEQWLRVLRDVTAVLQDRRAADWCCKQGMMAHPDRCPQHPAPVGGVVRDVGRGAEVWLAATEMTPAGWYAIGPLREEM